MPLSFYFYTTLIETRFSPISTDTISVRALTIDIVIYPMFVLIYYNYIFNAKSSIMLRLLLLLVYKANRLWFDGAGHVPNDYVIVTKYEKISVYITF